METKADLQKKVETFKTSHSLMIAGIIFFAIGVLEVIGIITDIRLLYLDVNLVKGETITIGRANFGTGAIVMIGSLIMCLIARLGNAIKAYKALRNK